MKGELRSNRVAVIAAPAPAPLQPDSENVFVCLYMHLNGQRDVMMGLMNAVAPLHIRFFLSFFSIRRGKGGKGEIIM